MENIFEKHCADLSLALTGVNRQDLDTLVQALDKVRKSHHQVFTIGNGGSAATAAHFANDLISLGVCARALTDSATITCIGNDFEYERIFEKQIRTHAKLGDILIAFSASGYSPNIINALEVANTYLGSTFAFTGFKGGKAKYKAIFSVHVPTEDGAYGIAEDSHLVLCHIISKMLKEKK